MITPISSKIWMLKINKLNQYWDKSKINCIIFKKIYFLILTRINKIILLKIKNRTKKLANKIMKILKINKIKILIKKKINKF
jgi:hypothetical protein